MSLQDLLNIGNYRNKQVTSPLVVSLIYSKSKLNALECFYVNDNISS